MRMLQYGRYASMVGPDFCPRPARLHHTQAPVVYFRAATAGACTYFDDRRDSGECSTGWLNDSVVADCACLSPR